MAQNGAGNVPNFSDSVVLIPRFPSSPSSWNLPFTNEWDGCCLSLLLTHLRHLVRIRIAETDVYKTQQVLGIRWRVTHKMSEGSMIQPEWSRLPFLLWCNELSINVYRGCSEIRPLSDCGTVWVFWRICCSWQPVAEPLALMKLCTNV